MTKRKTSGAFVAALCCLTVAEFTHAASELPIQIKAVVLSMFEVGQDQGDNPGEFQFWRERAGLDQCMPLAQGFHDVCLNPETGVLATVTGMGTARAAASVMALGMDPRFDLSKAYWLVAGIAGINPYKGSIGSAAWAEYVVDGDLGNEIDAREIPKSWKTGYTPFFRSTPYAQPRSDSVGEVYKLNTGLVNWAYNLTKDVQLVENKDLAAFRQQFKGFPPAVLPAKVMKGDNLASSTFWHGKKLNDWASEWVKYWTDGKGEFVTSAMEDTGTLQSLSFLSKGGKVDLDRVLVLRAASNYTMQPNGMNAAQSMAHDQVGFVGMVPSLEAAYRVGSTVIDELTGNWMLYSKNVPGHSVAVSDNIFGP